MREESAPEGVATSSKDAAHEWRGLSAAHDVLDPLQRAGSDLAGTELAQVEAKGKATASLLLHEGSLSVFLEDPRIPMDNNRSERLLRGPAISRYISFGSGGPVGARTLGRLLSVPETATLAGLNPYRYMLAWLAPCACNGGQAPSDLSPWLPWEMA